MQLKFADANSDFKTISSALTAAQISDDGYTASFTFPSSLNDDNRAGWFYSTTCHPDYKTRVEFTLGKKENLAFTQDEAGIMNKRHIFLHSGTRTVNIIANGQIPELAMSVIGSIFRVIPYTSAHQKEKILSVTFSSKDYIAGTVAYDRKADTCAYQGASTFPTTSTQSMTINLGTPFALEGVTDRNLSKGIYFALPATEEGAPLKGYKWVVKTDKTEYTFASDSQLEIKENVVKNIFLNLDKAVESRYVVSVGKTHFYKSGLQLPASEGVDRNVWCRFNIDGNPANKNSIVYTESKFLCVSEENYNAGNHEKVVDWLTCSCDGDTWKMDYKENTTGKQRVAYVIHRFPEGAEYSNYIFPDVPTQKVIQKAAE